MEKERIIEKILPYVKEVNSAVLTTITFPFFSVTKICNCFCIFDEKGYRWFASYEDLKQRTLEFYSKGLEQLKKEYELSEEKEKIIEHVKEAWKWKELNTGELVKKAEKTSELLKEWWEKTIVTEGIKYTDIGVFVDPFIKSKNLDQEGISLFNESLHLSEINRETKKELELMKFAERIRNGISEEEFQEGRLFLPKSMGFSNYELYEKEELEKITIEKTRIIDSEEALRKLKEKIELSKEEEEKIRITQYAAYVLDERKYFANLLNVCMHILIEEFSKRLKVNKKKLNEMTYEDFLRFINGEKIESTYPKVFFNKEEILSGEEGRKFFEEIENELEKYLEGDKILKGFGASSGKIKGKVRIILDPNEKIGEGEILVTYFTNPEYIPLMKKAGGIVTEYGGVSSHAAIVSRELRVPCIVGIKNIVRSLKEGEMIEIDGQKGTVERID